ncbi:protein of unknown function [Fontimonas thermophila]|uniref:DUF4266 domain-containing protein n=1 Tax=Fontimonas thermophila TaxID=1076937 RepID=A0A1I2H9X2_9GAMM|nr:DUF4266 domain-containing protein [Fontimonas thermophila]SFF26163.1 protein of unknown function [Fontimonas thermophila]
MVQWPWRLSVFAFAALTSACATVQPWQRGDLARTEMAFEPDAVLGAYRRHVEFSKEAASGGPTLGGGGCGCN